MNPPIIEGLDCCPKCKGTKLKFVLGEKEEETLYMTKVNEATFMCENEKCQASWQGTWHFTGIKNVREALLRFDCEKHNFHGVARGGRCPRCDDEKINSKCLVRK